MKMRRWIILNLVTVSLVLLSSCAFNLFANIETKDLLEKGTIKQKLEAASNALSSGNYDAAIAFAASVINEKLGLDLKIEDLETLLDSTSTIYEIAQALQNATATDELLDATKILLEAVALKEGKDPLSLGEEVLQILQELGIEFDFPSKSKNNSDFWSVIETNAGTLVAQLAGVFDDRHVLKLLTSGYYFVALNPRDQNLLWPSLCAFYDVSYMFNLLLDSNDDGSVTDETFVKDVITNPASIEELSEQATSGLYNDDNDCQEFLWAYGVLQDVLGILSIEATFPELSATDLSQREKIFDVLTLLFGE